MSDEIERLNKKMRELEGRINTLERDQATDGRNTAIIARNQAGFNGDIKRMDKILRRLEPLVDQNAKNIKNTWSTAEGNHTHLNRLVDRLQTNVDIADRNLMKTKSEVQRLDGRINKLDSNKTATEIKRLDARIDKVMRDVAKGAKGRR